MFDGVHPDFDSHPQSFSAECVAHHPTVALVRLIDECFEFISLEQNVLWSQAGCWSLRRLLWLS